MKEPISCPETSVNSNVCCVTSQKSEDLNTSEGSLTERGTLCQQTWIPLFFLLFPKTTLKTTTGFSVSVFLFVFCMFDKYSGSTEVELSVTTWERIFGSCLYSLSLSVSLSLYIYIYIYIYTYIKYMPLLFKFWWRVDSSLPARDAKRHGITSWKIAIFSDTAVGTPNLAFSWKLYLGL